MNWLEVQRLPASAWFAGVGAMAAALLAIGYANALDADFVFDDEASIVENSSIRRIRQVADVLAVKAEGGRTHDSRPLLNLSLAVDYAAHGLWRPGFRLVNLAIHLGNVLLVCDVARRILRLGGVRRGDARLLAAITALLWAVHPLHTSVNTYVIQRAESLAAFFTLAAFDAASVALSRGSLAPAVVAGLLAILGATAKETTAAIVPLVAAFDWAFRDRLRLATGKSPLVRPVLYGGLALNVVALALLGFLLGGRGGSAGLTTASVTAYALTQCRAIWLYLGKLLWPATLVLDHGEWLASGPGEVWPFVLATVALVAGVAAGFWRQPKVCFPLVAAAILLAPTTSIVPVKTQTIAEHRMYLPAAFLILWLVTAVALAARRFGCERRAGCRVAWVGLAAVLAMASVGRTLVRNRDFTTAATLWEQNVRDCPGNDRGMTNLVAALIREGRFEAAAPLARQAVVTHPERERNWLNCGRILAEQHRDAEAVEAFVEAIRRAPREADARINLGIVLSRGADFEAAIAVLDDAIRLRPDLAKGWLARGMVRLRQDRPDLARGDLEMAVRLDPENPAGRHNLELARRGTAGH